MRQGESSGITGTCPSVPSCCRDRSLPCLLQFIALLSLAVFSKEKTLSRICRITPVPPRWTSLGGLYVSHSDANPGRVLLKSTSQCQFFCGARKYPSCRPAGHFCSGTKSRQLTTFSADRRARMGEAKIHQPV